MLNKNHNKKIIIVEEESQNHEFFQRILSRKYHISCVENKETAYELINQENPDLIIISRNGRQTIDLCAKLKTKEQTKDIPILVIADDGSNIVEYYFRRVDGFLIKPFAESELLNHAQELIRSDEVL